jgi:MFS family permease
VIAVSLQTRLAFAVVIATAVALAAVVVLWRVPAGEGETSRITNGDSENPPPGVFSTMRERADALLRIGLPASMLSTARISRQIIVPLWGLGLGIDEVDIALIIGVCAAVDFALFYPGGQIIDRFGRLWAAVPCMLVFGATHVSLGLTRHLPEPTSWFIGLALLMAVGSGLSAGVVGAMGSDLADQRNPAAFLSSWRLVTEVGPSGAPLLISAVTATISLTAAPIAMGLLAFVSTVALGRYVPRYLPKGPQAPPVTT